MQWYRMHLHVLPAGPLQTNAYLLTEPAIREAVLIDAPEDVWPEVKALLDEEGCSLQELWLTHGHWDHTKGAAEVVKATAAKVRGHEADKVLFETPEVMQAYIGPGIRLTPVKPDFWIKQGDRFSALGVDVEVRHVPGHCPGNVLFYIAQLGAAFVGDALFSGSIGRTDLIGGDFAQLERSIRQQIYTLPDGTAVYPGHGPATSVGEEKASNPYVPA
jgi:glyoxylase-like metal-dependent hydrolase (beta-lactamase superfamily II)